MPKTTPIDSHLQNLCLNLELPPNVAQLDHHLTNYWDKKRAYLDIDSIIREHFEYKVQDAGCSA